MTSQQDEYIIKFFNKVSNTVTTVGSSDIRNSVSLQFDSLDDSFKAYFNIKTEYDFEKVKNILSVIYTHDLFIEYINKIIYNSNCNICCHFLTYQYNIWSNNWRSQYVNNPVKWREMLDKFSLFNTEEYIYYINSFKNIFCIAQTKDCNEDSVDILHKRIASPIFKMILACDEKLGIGFSNKIPWNCKQDQKMFKEITKHNIIICGRCTFNNLPYLKNREIWCLTRDKEYTPPQTRNIYKIFNDKDDIIQYINKQKVYFCKDIFIAGGKQIYELFINEVSFIHLSILSKTYLCDTRISLDLFDDFVCAKEKKYEEFSYKYLERHTNNIENQYLQLCKKVINESDYRQTRNSKVYSLFNHNLKCDLREGFPLLTTKKTFVRGIIEEILFFIKGETDTSILSNKSVNIWKGNTSVEFLKSRNLDYAEGIMGPMYGFQWRHFNRKYCVDDLGKPSTTSEDKGIDQLQNVINLINNDPTSRRILMTSFNPEQSEEGVLYPCHSIILQFYVHGEYLDLFCYNRSQDLFLGSPFNIASSALLLSIVSNITNKIPRYLHITMGDIHIYESHLESVKQQLGKIKYKLPLLTITQQINLEDIDNVNKEFFIIHNYKHNGTIKSEMIV
jgi:dihydrofolate reductase / thymidylate synthase